MKLIAIIEMVLIHSVWGHFNGPFVFFGHDQLAEMKSSALGEPDTQFLIDLYNKAPAIIVFTRNISTKLTDDNFPAFKDLLSQTQHIYITSHQLDVDPIEYNVNTEVVNLIGPSSQQDIEMAALYRDASITYGSGKVLGILSTNDVSHVLRKRDAEVVPVDQPVDPITTATSIEQASDGEKQKTDFVFYPIDSAAYKILLYTQLPPTLKNGSDTLVLDDTKTTMTTNKRGEAVKTLKVRYNSQARPLELEYIFTSSGGTWMLGTVEVNGIALFLSTKLLPSAPMGFSYTCSKSLVFENNGVSLQFSNIQVQMNVLQRSFSTAYDCVGFTTISIWSGLFIGALLCLVAGIGLSCVVSIKAPSKFESTRSKQLTFTVQE